MASCRLLSWLKEVSGKEGSAVPSGNITTEEVALGDSEGCGVEERDPKDGLPDMVEGILWL